MLSPFLLAGTLAQHLSSQEDKFPTEVAENKDDLNVDDLLTGDYVVEEVQHLKDTEIHIFRPSLVFLGGFLNDFIPF